MCYSCYTIVHESVLGKTKLCSYRSDFRWLTDFFCIPKLVSKMLVPVPSTSMIVFVGHFIFISIDVVFVCTRTCWYNSKTNSPLLLANHSTMIQYSACCSWTGQHVSLFLFEITTSRYVPSPPVAPSTCTVSPKKRQAFSTGSLKGGYRLRPRCIQV